MAELQVARARINCEGMHKDQLVLIDPDKWPEHLRLGYLTLVTDEELISLGLKAGEEEETPGRAKIVS